MNEVIVHGEQRFKTMWEFKFVQTSEKKFSTEAFSSLDGNGCEIPMSWHYVNRSGSSGFQPNITTLY